MAATTYTTTQAVTLATLDEAYLVLSVLFLHLAMIKRQFGINLIITALQLNGNNTVSVTLNNPLPNAAIDQLQHLGIA